MSDLLTGQPVRDQLARIGGGSGVVEDRHVGRMRLQLVPPLLPHSADMMPAETVRDHADAFAAVSPHHEMMLRPENLICSGQHQLPQVAA